MAAPPTLTDTGKQGLDRALIGSQKGLPFRRHAVALAARPLSFDGGIAHVLKARECRIHNAWAGAVATARALLNGLEQFVPVPRLFCDNS